jgi:hypothetical protein
MKWYNKNRTKMVDLDKVSFFEYGSNNILKLSIEGFPIEIVDDALEVYSLLISNNKEVINS